jgi:hypothetical protein
LGPFEKLHIFVYKSPCDRILAHAVVLQIMKISQRSKEELSTALTRVEAALAEKPTKAMVVKTLFKHGWCSPNSAGIEATFLKACKAQGVELTPNFSKVMGEVAASEKPAPTTAEPAPAPAALAPVPSTETTPEGPGDFTVMNLKAVSLLQTKSDKTTTHLIGSDEVLSGSVGASVLRSNCSLIEFAI